MEDGIGRFMLPAAAAALVAGVGLLVGVLIAGGDLGDAWDDLVVVPFALAALLALAGWWLNRRAVLRLLGAARAEREWATSVAAGREAQLEEQSQRLREAGEREAALRREREALEAEALRRRDEHEEAVRRRDEEHQRGIAEHVEETRRREEQYRRQLAEHVQEARGRDEEHARRVAALERETRERELAHEREKAQLKERLRMREQELGRERELRIRVDQARMAERAWARELRDQLSQMHRELGSLGDAGDVRALVLRVARTLVEAEKGLLLSREDRDGDGQLDLVCHEGFENDPSDSAVAHRFAELVLERDATVREDEPGDPRTPADREIENLLAIPIFIADEFGGVIVCANRRGGFEQLDDDVLLSLGDHAGAVLENGRLQGELRSSYLATVRMLAQAVEARDPSLWARSEEASRYVGPVARELGLERGQTEELTFAALLRDVGKMAISERILLKPGPLSTEERRLVELHPQIGYRVVQQVPVLSSMAHAVLHHHERFDGGGYPSGLAGEEIPLEARILFVVDAFGAMISERPNRAALSVDEACAELERGAGTQFDPRVVRLFVSEVRKRPPAEQPEPSLTEDSEVEARRALGEPVLGYRAASMSDGLTLLHSHRYFHEAAEAEGERASLQRRPFAVVLVELTDLPLLNRRDGYAAGDEAIVEAARALERAAARSGGTACRYSGRRLGLLVPRAGDLGARALAAEVEADLAGSNLAVRTGTAAWREGDSGEEVVARARLALAVREVEAAPESLE